MVEHLQIGHTQSSSLSNTQVWSSFCSTNWPLRTVYCTY